MNKSDVRITFRIPAELHRWIMEQADADHRSNNSFLVKLVQQAKDSGNAKPA